MAENQSEFTKNIRLNKPQDVRKMLARIINVLLQDGPMTLDKAKTIVSLSNTALKSMELGDLSERLEKIESLLEHQDKKTDVTKRR